MPHIDSTYCNIRDLQPGDIIIYMDSLPQVGSDLSFGALKKYNKKHLFQGLVSAPGGLADASHVAICMGKVDENKYRIIHNTWKTKGVTEEEMEGVKRTMLVYRPKNRLLAGEVQLYAHRYLDQIDRGECPCPSWEPLVAAKTAFSAIADQLIPSEISKISETLLSPEEEEISKASMCSKFAYEVYKAVCKKLEIKALFSESSNVLPKQLQAYLHKEAEQGHFDIFVMTKLAPSGIYYQLITEVQEAIRSVQFDIKLFSFDDKKDVRRDAKDFIDNELMPVLEKLPYDEFTKCKYFMGAVRHKLRELKLLDHIDFTKTNNFLKQQGILYGDSLHYDNNVVFGDDYQVQHRAMLLDLKKS